ncbi:TadE/TadG family type IV pilus assembly protein [Mangrovicella endophytica]|uniref:TadE/TadG family type IV pilus assembly protein n=1 Tax=Mangrovicella endophytica TaxID=2066697 RepID=UPI000C9E065D|nr:TadE/TadG family type IV pilus assembly protein [Mangrovicella endophytica]
MNDQRQTMPDQASSPRSLRTRARLFSRDRSGATVIEFAMLALPFFGLVFATLETSLVFLGEVALDHAVEQVGRKIRTGEVAAKKMDEATFKKEICDQVSYLMDCSKLKIDLNTYTSFASIPILTPMKDGDVDSSGFGYKLPAGETITALRVYYKWPIFTDVMRKYLSDTADGSHLLFGMAAFRTEPYTS